MTNLSDNYKDNLPFESSKIVTITSNYNANSGDTIFVNTASSAITVILPSSPNPGSKIKVLDIATNSQNNNITLLGNGNNIGGASAYIINTPDASLDLLYINSNKGWNIVGEYISLTKPGIPTSVSATDIGTNRAYNNGAATVSFVPSTSGDIADYYTVTSTPGSYSATGTSSPIIVQGLQSNTNYTFTVTATNGAGTSGTSTSSGSITATTVPQAPTLNSVTYGFEKLTASFTGNASGGKSITLYTTTPSGLSGVNGSSPVELTTLTGGTNYSVTVTATNANGTSLPSNAISSTPFTTSGGSISSYSSGGVTYRHHTFNSTSNFVLTGNNITADFLVIAGAGGGGSDAFGGGGGGGGGAGGYRTSAGTSGGGAGPETSLTLTPGTYAATIGGGGGVDSNGSDSTFHTVTSTAGGAGGRIPGTNAADGGNSGGSGGGGGAADISVSGGSGTANQGYSGGSRSGGGSDSGGGGGGAGSAGSAGSGQTGGSGGSGVASSITGTSVTRAGGGGGGRTSGGASGGGGAGSRGVSGSSNTGGGGGGGANGGSGIVIVRYSI